MATLVCNLPSVFPTSSISQSRLRASTSSNSRVLLHQSPILARHAQVVRSRKNMAHEGQTPPVIPQQKVIIQNSHGEKLVGVLHNTGSTELVILCHGFRSSKEYDTLMNLAAALEKEGISVFRFDFAGNGESEGSFQYGNYRREAEDLHAVVLHFSGVKHQISAILGHSKGGNAVLLYASRYPDVHTVVNVSGRFNLERGIAGRLGKSFMERIKKDGFIDVKDDTGKVEYRVTEESIMDRLTTDMRAACLSIQRDCRVLTVHGSKDEIVPAEDAMEFAKVIPNHKLHIIEGADHGYTAHQAELTAIVLEFMRAGIQQEKDMPNQVEDPYAPRDT
ncbi:uncharacterized protein LOC122669553 isoform X2 [Telopea speciosissima]|uniref:uncharacterized protein LOC122669553 isoform X2 n=1 Tax=Telopea speciosissima TaxID=54955 RepID=UPI001CC82DFA|nr:uncharacterized protein LOC122669553 isoform X2 [Telopea speciosissima]